MTDATPVCPWCRRKVLIVPYQLLLNWYSRDRNKAPEYSGWYWRAECENEKCSVDVLMSGSGKEYQSKSAARNAAKAAWNRWRRT